MKKLLTFAIVFAGLIIGSCTKSEEGDEDKLGSIYGIVTELSTAEPMRAMGVNNIRAISCFTPDVSMPYWIPRSQNTSLARR